MLALVAAAVATTAGTVVGGYLPEYRFGSVQLQRAAQLGLTDVVLFSLTPAADGNVDGAGVSTRLLAVKAAADDAGINASICVGGAGRSGAFATFAADPPVRRRFARRLARFAATHGMSGVDLDAQGLGAKAYAALVLDVRAALDELAAASADTTRLTLSVALRPGLRLGRAAWAAIDRAHLMAYDDGADPAGHATMGGAERAVEQARSAGVPARKIVLGVPFYGRRTAASAAAAAAAGECGGNARACMADARTYAEAAEALGAAVQRRGGGSVDAGEEVGGFVFNGPALVAAKARWAVRHGLCGVFAWELGQDELQPVAAGRAVSVTAGQGQEAEGAQAHASERSLLGAMAGAVRDAREEAEATRAAEGSPTVAPAPATAEAKTHPSQHGSADATSRRRPGVSLSDSSTSSASATPPIPKSEL